MARKLPPSRRRWKVAERRIAAYFGGRRVPVTGRARGDVPDVEHDWLSLECKSWGTMPQRVEDALRQAEAANTTGEKLPIAVVHGVGEPYGAALVVMRASDFMDWFGGGCQERTA